MFFIIVFILGALALSVSGSLTFWPVTKGLDFYIPIVLFIAGFFLTFILFVLISVTICLFLPSKQSHNKPNQFAKFWFTQALGFINIFLFQINAKVNGKKRLPKHERFLLVANHRGNFDPMVLIHKLGYLDLAFILKRWTFNIPFAKNFMNALCYLPIDRDDMQQSLSVIKKGEEYLSNKVTSIATFPEGTRHLDCKLGDFHEGVFNVAIKGHAPIVVATITGTEKLRKFSLKIKKVRIDILEKIPYEEIENKTAKEVAELVREIISTHLEKLESK